MSRLARLEAKEASIKVEKKLAKIEDEFVAKKLAGTVTRDDRLELREARQFYRENHRKPKVNGASPEAIGAKTGVEV